MTGQKVLCALSTCQRVFSSLSNLCPCVLQMAVSQCLLAAYLGSAVQLPPRVKYKDVIDALIFLSVEDRLTRWKRQEAHTERAKSMLHTCFERTNDNAVRVCDCGAGHGVARPQAVLPAA